MHSRVHSRCILLQNSFVPCIIPQKALPTKRRLRCRLESNRRSSFFFSVPCSTLSSSRSLLIELLESLEPLVPIAELGSEGKKLSRSCKIVGDSVETSSMFYWAAGSIVLFSMLLEFDRVACLLRWYSWGGSKPSCQRIYLHLLFMY